MKETIYPGVNVQWPWSGLLLNGSKIVETRTYPLPAKYRNQWLALIETPGPKGKREASIHKARITGLVRFGESFRYPDAQKWIEDKKRHLVDSDDPQFTFGESEKWGWVVTGIFAFQVPVAAPEKKGIVFASNCLLPFEPVLPL